MYDTDRPAWPGRSPIDIASVKAVWDEAVGAALDWFCRTAIEEAMEERGMRNVEFDPYAWDEMWLHAKNHPEEEVVGVLLGTATSERTHVIVAVELANMASDKRSFYEVDPVQMCKLWDTVDESSGPETVVGFYHSHPFTGAEPSEADWALCHPGYSYVICSLRDKEARSFMIGDGTRGIRHNGRS